MVSQLNYTVLAIYGRSEAMKRYIGTCLPHAGRYMQSRTGAVTQVSILPQSFFCYCRITFLLLPHHFFAIAASFFANCNEKIAAPRRTRVTNATNICRTSLVARYAATLYCQYRYTVVKKEKDKMLRVMTNCPPT